MSGVTIYIGNLRYKRDEEGIKKLFERYGKVDYVDLITDPKTKLSKGIAFVRMPVRKQALYAIDKLNGREIDGRTLKVSVAQDRFEQPVKAEAKVARKPIKEVLEQKKKPIRKRREKGLKVLFNYLNS
jgi:RNA recognition motif-containing protein